MSENGTFVQKVITVPRTSIVQHQTNDEVIKILIEYPDGEQKLVGFQVSDESCMIQDLLAQVGISPESEIDVSLVEDPSTLQIHYIVEVKHSESIINDEIPSYSQEFQTEPTPPPPEIEVPKFVEGKLAVCRRCGFLSSTFHRCQRCKRKLPENVKAVIDKYTANGGKKLSKENENRLSGDFKQKTENSEIDENNGVSEILSLGNSTSGGNVDDSEGGSELQFSDGYTKSQCTALTCRTVRIGSYKYFPPEKIIISHQGVRLSVPIADKKIVKLEVRHQEIDRVLIHFGRNLPVIFLTTTPNSAERIREKLGMRQRENPYYDPLSLDPTHKQITLLPENINEDSQNFLRDIFQMKLEQLTMPEANEILVRASPREPAKRFRIRRMSDKDQGQK